MLYILTFRLYYVFMESDIGPYFLNYYNRVQELTVKFTRINPCISRCFTLCKDVFRY